MVQKTNKNLIVVQNFKRKMKKEIKVERLIFFGSRVKGTFTENSDFDILIVSKDFQNIPWYKRPVKLYLIWKEDYPLELLCYTPEEMNEKEKKAGIVSEALQTGIEV